MKVDTERVAWGGGDIEFNWLLNNSQALSGSKK